MRFKEQTLLAGLCILAKVLQHWRNELPSIKAQSSEVTSIPLALAHINLLKHGIFTSLYGVLVSCLLEEMGTREGREKKGGFRFAEEMLFLQIWKFRSLGFVPSLSHFNARLLTAFVLFAWKFSIYQKLLGHKRCTGTQRNCQPWTLELQLLPLWALSSPFPCHNFPLYIMEIIILFWSFSPCH